MPAKLTAVLVLIAMVGVASGQEEQVTPYARQPVSTITNVGTATVEAPPELVRFWLHKRVGGAFAEALKEVLATGAALRKALVAMDLGPYDYRITPPALS
ncbi:MAG TPA: hypothetical protein ENN80_03875, partial [Candidatus Hydrogenedentes bacterium]|nr:hypothetical protein [Candidatus Hydrogenedentota bacterium]